MIDADNEKFRPRKRIRNLMNHKDYVKKKKVQSGKSYTTKCGRNVEEKIFIAQEKCNCKNRCAVNINAMRQRETFIAFYELENWSKKTIFLRSMVKRHDLDRNLNPIINLKKKNNAVNEYYMTDEAGIQHRVCRQFILKCLLISKCRLSRALNSIVTNESAKEKRGSFPTRKTNMTDIDFLKTFINKFPAYESHYNLNRSKRKYLSPFWNQSRMYREYQLICNFEKRKVLTFTCFTDTCFVLSSTHSLI